MRSRVTLVESSHYYHCQYCDGIRLFHFNECQSCGGIDQKLAPRPASWKLFLGGLLVAAVVVLIGLAF